MQATAPAKEPIKKAIAIAPDRLIRVLAICVLFLILCGVTSAVVGPIAGNGVAESLLQKFDLDAENTVPAWFSATCLLLCALVLGFISAAEREQESGLSRRWLQLAVLFALLSLDEAASFHERLVNPVKRALQVDGFFRYAWVIPGVAFVLVFLLVFAKFLSRLPAPARRAFVLSGMVYCSGCLGMEMIDGKYASIYGENNLNYRLLVVVEESLEMTGALLFLRSLLEYLATHVGDVSIHWMASASGTPPRLSAVGRADPYRRN